MHYRKILDPRLGSSSTFWAMSLACRPMPPITDIPGSKSGRDVRYKKPQQGSPAGPRKIYREGFGARAEITPAGRDGRGCIREGKSHIECKEGNFRRNPPISWAANRRGSGPKSGSSKMARRNPEEADRDLQRAESERAIELAGKARRFFPVPANEPDEPGEGVLPNPQ